jgi:hypothetical protein
MSAISLSTIASRIKESGEFNSFWAAKMPFISDKNKKIEWNGVSTISVGLLLIGEEFCGVMRVLSC